MEVVFIMAKKKVRGNNEGSIFTRKIVKDGKGYEIFVGAVTTGYDPITKKQIKKQFTGKTRAEVNKKMTEALSKIQAGTYIKPTALTVEKWMNDWLTGRKPHITENTYFGYENMIKHHIVPTIGKTKLKDLTTRDIQNLLNSKLENGRADGKKGGLSRRSVKYIYDTINTALQQAVNERIIPFNVADAVEIPKQVKREMITMTQDEITIFLDTVKNYQLNHHHSSPLFAAFYLELSTGIRRGELLGLHWTEVNFEKKQIFIKTQLLRGKNGLYFQEPKTEKSKRPITLGNTAIEVLKMHQIRQDEIKSMLGKEVYRDNGLVFCTNEGNPIYPRNFVRHFETLLDKAGLNHYRFHDLRHTFSTIQLENGIPPKTLQEILGHSTFKTTMDTYSHVTPAMHQNAADTIDGILAACAK
jgi:integrase